LKKEPPIRQLVDFLAIKGEDSESIQGPPMFTVSIPKVSSSIAQAIEDAILLGGAKEISNIIELVKDDDCFPETLLYGLEALYHFRRAYGAGGDMAPSKAEDKKRVLEMEATWGRELIESLGYYADLAETKYA
jgi:hypothetical protein